MLTELLKTNQAAKRFYKLVLSSPQSTQLKKFSALKRKLIQFKRFQVLLQVVNIAFDYHHKYYFDLLKLDTNKRELMKKQNLAQFIVKNILATEEYGINGLAYYTNTTTDIIEDIERGNLIYPSYYVMNKLLEIFFSINKKLCEEIWEKAFE